MIMATGKKTWNKLTNDQKKNTYSSYTGVAPEHVDLTGMDYNDLPKDVKRGVKQSQLKAKLLKMKLAASTFKSPKPKLNSRGTIPLNPDSDDDRSFGEIRAEEEVKAQHKAKLLKMKLAVKKKDKPIDPVEHERKTKEFLKNYKAKPPTIAEKFTDDKIQKEGDKMNKQLKKEHDSQPLIKEVPFGKDTRDNSKINYFTKMQTENTARNTGKKIRPKKPTNKDFGGIITAKAKVNKLKKKYVDPNPQAETPEEIRQSAESAGREPTYIAQEHNHKISFRGHKIGGFKSASLDEQSGKYAKYWLLNAKETNGNGWGIAAHTAKDNMKKFIGRPLVVTAQSWHGASEYGEEYEHPYLPTNDINAILNHQEKFRVGSIVDVFEDKQGDWFASVEMLPKFASSRLPPFCSPAIYQLDASEAEGQISKWEALHLAALTENPAYGARIALLKGTCVGTDNECKVQFKAAKQEPGIECPIKAKQKKVKAKLSKLKKKQKIAGVNLPKTKRERFDETRKYVIKRREEGKAEISKKENTALNKYVIDNKRISKLKLKLANLGEQNMTYQDSKKVKIHKKKHPEVRKAKSSVEDILRGKGRSVDGTHHESTFLSTKGDFIGGGDSHAGQALDADSALSEILDVNNVDGIVERFSSDYNIPKVQHFKINREGDTKTSVGIFSKINSTQLKSLKDIEAGGGTLGFAVGTSVNDIDGMSTGEGYRDLTKILREKKFLG